MTELDDHELLAEFARNESEAAFAALAARYVNLVYSAALRFTGNAHHAEEITQAVFIILARKAGGLRRGTVLSGWLYQTARLTAANFVKGEIRRQRREQEAYMQSTLNEPDAAAWEQIAPLLDEAMGRLGETDRNAIVLRFFENKTVQEVGAKLKLNEAAAHKRVNRAVEKLRKFFTKRGVTLSAAALGGALAANSVQAAPIGLAITVAATAAKGSAVAASTLTLIKGALKIMAWTKAKTAVVVGAAVLLAAGTATPFAVHHYRVAAQRISSVHIRGQMRTYPNDNFSAIAADGEFVTVELWKQFTPKAAWRVEKPGRVAVMDGSTTLAYFKAENMAMKVPQAVHDAFDTYWIHDLAEFKTSLTNELKTARAKGWKVDTATTWVGGKKKSVVTIEVKSGLPDSSNQKNHFIGTSDQRKVYRFDEQTLRLESVQIYLEEPAGETLVFESTQIDYNQTINPALFHLDLPADVAWYQEPQKVAGPDPYAKLTADQAARSFFEACSREDWTEVSKFWITPINDQLKQYLGGVKIINLGAAYSSAPYPGRFVPYEIELRPQELNVRVSNTNAAGRYVITGTYDSKLQLQEDFNWTNQPPALADADADAKLPPAAIVKAYFQAMANSDWTELAKFTTESDAANTKRQVEEAKKLGVPLPEFEVGEEFWSADHSSLFVKCHMKGIKKFRMAIRNDNPAKHWIVDGGI